MSDPLSTLKRNSKSRGAARPAVAPVHGADDGLRKVPFKFPLISETECRRVSGGDDGWCAKEPRDTCECVGTLKSPNRSLETTEVRVDNGMHIDSDADESDRRDVHDS